jgi:hypothetical protein
MDMLNCALGGRFRSAPGPLSTETRIVRDLAALDTPSR